MISARQFLGMLKEECTKLGVTTLFPETEKVKYSDDGMLYTSGYFDGDAKIIACAVGKPEEQWFEILVHESCHMDQWAEEATIWDDYNEYVDTSEWIAGEYIPKAALRKSFETSVALELDCEKRAVKKMMDLELDIDVERYIQKANSYLLFYTVVSKTRRWYDVAPYDVPELVDRMSTLLLDDYTAISDELLDLYKKLCYK